MEKPRKPKSPIPLKNSFEKDIPIGRAVVYLADCFVYCTSAYIWAKLKEQ